MRGRMLPGSQNGAPEFLKKKVASEQGASCGSLQEDIKENHIDSTHMVAYSPERAAITGEG